MRKIVETPKGFNILFDYNQNIVKDIQLIPGRQFNYQDKSWFAPLSSRSFINQLAKTHRFQIGDRPAPKPIENMRIPEMPILNQDIPLKRQLFGYQRQGVAYNLIHKKVILGDAPGLGKSQTLDSLIATPKGWVKMGDVKIGDQIFAKDGTIQYVQGVYPQGLRPAYKVTMNDGFSVECDEEHLWAVRDRNRRDRGTGYAIKSLKEIISMGIHEKASEKRLLSGRNPVLKFEIPLTEAVQFEEKQFVIHPYIIGMLLGDGCLANQGRHGICISIPDSEKESVKRIENLLPDGMHLQENRHPVCPQYYFSQHKTTRKNPFKEEIIRLGLNVRGENKFIPIQYQQGSISQRMDLLRGLMDSDGSTRLNRTTFHSCCKQLIYDISELIQSLGGQAIIREYDRSKEGKSTEYQVNARMNECPFYLERKANSWNKSKRNGASRRIKSIEYVGEKECQCIKVSSPDSLYLTNHYIVTHNTAQAIATVIAAQAFPCLVICPSSLKINWEREFEMWGNHKATILSDSIKDTWDMLYQMRYADIFIVNYESLKKYFVAEINQPIGKDGKKVPLRLNHIKFKSKIKLFKSIICDESHRVKDIKTQTTKFVKGISVGKEYVYLLTGTPVVNKPDDLVSQIGILDRMNDFGGYQNFKANYCDNSDRFQELNYLLKKNCFYRREKADVLKELPPKMRQIVLCDITTRKEYSDALSDLEDYLKRYRQASDAQIQKSMKGEIMVRIGILKNISARGKIKDAIEYISDVIDSGEKLILFTHLREVQDMIMKSFPAAVSILGDDDTVTRQKNVDRFQNDPKVQLIVCSIKAAGVGITLTASSRVAFLELPWHPADCEQCEDRAHRIGQLDSVSCVYLLGKDTIDEHIYDIIDKKRSVSNAITGARDDVEMSVQSGVINLLSKNI